MHINPLVGKPDHEYCLFLEDDLEVSAYWFTWLRKAWRAYSHRTDVAGISLQRQTQMYKKLENNYDPAKVQDVRIQVWMVLNTSILNTTNDICN